MNVAKDHRPSFAKYGNKFAIYCNPKAGKSF